MMAEPVDADIDALACEFRRALAAELEMRISTAIAGRHLPDQDARGRRARRHRRVLEGLVGPSAPSGGNAARPCRR